MADVRSAISSGYLADKIGRKWVLAVGDAWFTLGAIIICSSFSVPQMIVGRFILGLGELFHIFIATAG